MESFDMELKTYYNKVYNFIIFKVKNEVQTEN